MADILWPLTIYQSIPSNWRSRMGSSLRADGTFHVWTPGVLRDRPEIGYYVHALGAERALEFRMLVEDLGVWDLPGIHFMRPEQPRVNFIAGDVQGTDKRVVIFSIDDLPPQVITVMDAFHRLVEEAVASPKQVLAGAARSTRPKVAANEPLRLEFTLRNKGTDVPLLKLLVAPVPTPDRPHPSPTRVDITPAMMTRPDQARPRDAGPPGELLELAPGQALQFTATANVYLSPGEHRAVLTLSTGEGSQFPANHVRGVLALELPSLHIVPET
jgi:hypothetical protein